VRPEHVRLDDSGFDAVVKSAEYLGADTVVTCSTSAGGTLADTIAARLPGQHDLAAGARVRLGWSPEHTHWFDAETNRRREDVDAAVAA